MIGKRTIATIYNTNEGDINVRVENQCIVFENEEMDATNVHFHIFRDEWDELKAFIEEQFAIQDNNQNNNNNG